MMENETVALQLPVPSGRRTVVVDPDTRPDQPNEIDLFMHCKKCLRDRPPTLSPRDYAALDVGLRPDGTVQVWCWRHEANVAIMRTSVV